jgi:hypothetical protein
VWLIPQNIVVFKRPTRPEASDNSVVVTLEFSLGRWVKPVLAKEISFYKLYVPALVLVPPYSFKNMSRNTPNE